MLLRATVEQHAGRCPATLIDLGLDRRKRRQAFDMRIPVHIGMVGPRLWFISGVLVVTVVGAIGMVSDLSRPYHGAVNVSSNALQWTIDRIELDSSSSES